MAGTRDYWTDHRDLRRLHLALGKGQKSASRVMSWQTYGERLQARTEYLGNRPPHCRRHTEVKAALSWAASVASREMRARWVRADGKVARCPVFSQGSV